MLLLKVRRIWSILLTATSGRAVRQMKCTPSPAWLSGCPEHTVTEPELGDVEWWRWFTTARGRRGNCPVQNNRGDCAAWLFSAAFGDFLMIHSKWFGQATLLYSSAHNLVCFPLCAVTNSAAAAYGGLTMFLKMRTFYLSRELTYGNIGESIRTQKTSEINWMNN